MCCCQRRTLHTSRTTFRKAAGSGTPWGPCQRKRPGPGSDPKATNRVMRAPLGSPCFQRTVKGVAFEGHLKPLHSRLWRNAAALATEKRSAERLRKRGYAVWWG